MKKPRLHRWRWLLALLLGVGTWWGVGRWLGPKEHLHHTYPIVKNQNNQARPGDELYRYHARILDTAGKYLYVEEASGHGPLHYEVIDLHTRQKLARHEIWENSVSRSKLEEYETKANPDGIVHFVEYTFFQKPRVPEKQIIKKGNVTFEVLEDGPIVIGRPSSPEIWEWDVIRNQTRPLRQYTSDFIVNISQDGSTLLEIERITPLMPSLFWPHSLATVIGGVAEYRLQCNDLAIMRVSSLPQLKLRSTVVLPWMERRGCAQLTIDGAYLVIPDAEAPEGFTSPRKFKKQGGHHVQVGGARGLILDREVYASSSPWLRVFDTQNGQLWWEKTGYSAFYPNCDTETVAMIKFTASGSILDRPTNANILLHLPSKQATTTSLCTSISPLNNQRTHSLQIDPFDLESGFEIVITDKDGKSERLPNQGLNSRKLLPNATQYLKERQSSYSQLLPDWLADWMTNQNLLVNWLKDEWRTLEVSDYANKRMLWTTRSRNRLAYDITDHWLLISENEDDVFKLSVYALPFPSWSPWWARGSGMVMALLVWLWLRRYKKRRDVLP